jgi:hypothetical protein
MRVSNIKTLVLVLSLSSMVDGCKKTEYRDDNTDCVECRSESWCDGTDYHNCPGGMGSPMGSSEIGNCTCHVGHIRNESTCLVCPEGSWCDINGQHSCPNGTTSNPAGQSHEDCYCLDDYTGDLNCTARINTTNHRCDPGYRYDGPRWDDSSGIRIYYDYCQACNPTYWCDGMDYFQCPDWTVGSAIIHNYVAKSFDDCFCPLGYISDNGNQDNKCIACPEGKWCDRDGEHNISTTVTSAVETPARKVPNVIITFVLVLR